MIVTNSYIFLFPMHTEEKCDKFPALANGNISYDHDPSPSYPHGTEANFTCNEGYTLSINDPVLCNDGNWSDNAATCNITTTIGNVDRK